MFGFGFAGIISSMTKAPSGGGYDADAQSFITASGITDLTQKGAVNQLVLDLKSNSLWSGIKALYPFVGGNASAHSYNLKNTSSFQIAWVGGVTHNSDGISFNGTNGYGDTGLTPSTSLSLDSTLVGTKLKTNYNSNFAFGATVTARIQLYRAFSDTYHAVNSGTESNVSLADSAGIIIVNRNSSTNQSLYKNATLVHSGTATSTSLPTSKIFISCRSSGTGGPSLYAPTYQQLFIISDGVSSISTLNTILQTYLTTLGR